MDSITPSRLIDTRCQINEMLSSSMNTKTASCLLEMTIEDSPAVEGEKPKQQTISMELPSATLRILIEDLSRIRDQLSNLAKKQ